MRRPPPDQRSPAWLPPTFEREPATVLDAFLENLERYADKPLYTFPEGDAVELTWARIGEQAYAVVDELRRRNVAPGDRVVLAYLPDSTWFPGALWGCLLAGAVAVPVAPARPLTLKEDAARFSRLVSDCGARVALTDTLYRRLVRVGSATRLAHGALRRDAPAWPKTTWIATDRLRPAPRPAAPVHAAAPDDLAYLQYTSGSTSDPKGVEVRHRQLLANLQAMGRDAAMTPDDVLAGWAPWFHDMGLVAGFFNVAYCACHGVYFSPLAFLADPTLWPRVIHEYRATATAGPNFGYTLATRRTTPEAAAALDLSCVRLALLGGEMARPATLRAFAARFSSAGFSAEAFRNVYGMAEAVLYICGIDQGMSETIAVNRAALAAGRAERIDPAAPDAVELTSVGQTHPDEESSLLVVRDGAICDEGEVGELWLSSPSVAGAYFGRDDLSTEAFGATLAGSEGRFLRTGDLGFRLGGEAYLCGREKDLIIVAGRNVHPEDLEHCIDGVHAAIRPGCIGAFAHTLDGTDEVVVVCEVRDGKTPVAQLRGEVVPAIRLAVSRSHSLPCHSVVLLQPRTIPKTTSGKVQRGRCRRDWLAGRLSVLYEESEGSPS